MILFIACWNCRFSRCCYIIDVVVTSVGVGSVAFGLDGISGIGGAAVCGDGVVPLEV